MRRSLAVAGAVAVGLLVGCSSSQAGPHIATLTAVVGTSSATLNVLTGTTDLTITTANFGAAGPLVRVSTPARAAAPHLDSKSGAGTVVDLTAQGASSVTVTLNAAVSWQLNLGGGTTRTSADLRGTQVRGVTITAGSDVISLTLPQPHGSVPVLLRGGATSFQVSVPSGVQAQVTAGGGAGKVSLEGQVHVGVAGGSTFATPGWTQGGAGFDVDATAGASQVTVTARTAN
jgi:hypothetical protein